MSSRGSTPIALDKPPPGIKFSLPDRSHRRTQTETPDIKIEPGMPPKKKGRRSTPTQNTPTSTTSTPLNPMNQGETADNAVPAGNNHDKRIFTREEVGDLYGALTPAEFLDADAKRVALDETDVAESPSVGAQTCKRKRKSDVDVLVDVDWSYDYHPDRHPESTFTKPSALKASAVLILLEAGFSKEAAAQTITETEKYFFGPTADPKWRLLSVGKLRHQSQPCAQGILYWMSGVTTEIYLHPSIWVASRWGGEGGAMFSSADKYLQEVAKNWRKKVEEERKGKGRGKGGVPAPTVELSGETEEQRKVRILGSGSTLLDTAKIAGMIKIGALSIQYDVDGTSNFQAQQFDYATGWVWSEDDDTSGRAMRGQLREFFEEPESTRFQAKIVCSDDSGADEDLAAQRDDGVLLWFTNVASQVEYDRAIANALEYGSEIRGKKKLTFIKIIEPADVVNVTSTAASPAVSNPRPTPSAQTSPLATTLVAESSPATTTRVAQTVQSSSATKRAAKNPRASPMKTPSTRITRTQGKK